MAVKIKQALASGVNVQLSDGIPQTIYYTASTPGHPAEIQTSQYRFVSVRATVNHGQLSISPSVRRPSDRQLACNRPHHRHYPSHLE